MYVEISSNGVKITATDGIGFSKPIDISLSRMEFGEEVRDYPDAPPSNLGRPLTQTLHGLTGIMGYSRNVRAHALYSETFGASKVKISIKQPISKLPQACCCLVDQKQFLSLT
ncbi:13214_t:CDS:2 [Funneliformis mosseae]|uniref:13214_t:CDS:1 n=1 Tax=Funneliformis mosseae TaxID=27381 RepID=A0A9N9E3G5_FUNMO|nr:13214_t:CDS:2 [Funneliformis mosseae]